MLTAAVAAAIGIAVPVGVLSQQAPTSAAVLSRAASGAAGGLGQLSGLLPRNKLTEESAIQVNLSPTRRSGCRSTRARQAASGSGTSCWTRLTPELAHDLGVNYAPKLANIAISDPAAVQTVTLGSPTPHRTRSGRRW